MFRSVRSLVLVRPIAMFIAHDMSRVRLHTPQIDLQSMLQSWLQSIAMLQSIVFANTAIKNKKLGTQVPGTWEWSSTIYLYCCTTNQVPAILPILVYSGSSTLKLRTQRTVFILFYFKMRVNVETRGMGFTYVKVIAGRVLYYKTKISSLIQGGAQTTQNHTKLLHMRLQQMLWCVCSLFVSLFRSASPFVL